MNTNSPLLRLALATSLMAPHAVAAEQAAPVEAPATEPPAAEAAAAAEPGAKTTSAEAADPAPEPAPQAPAEVPVQAEPAKKGLRSLSTDRPDVTESPYTVDRGHFQAEFDLGRFTTDAGVESYSFASSNLKMGLTDFWEVQLVIDGLVGVPTATGEHEWGSGSMDIRTKFNLLGNDSGPVAIGVMPWLTFPHVGLGEQIEGGLIGLMGISLPADFATGFMAEADFVKNELDSDYHFELLTTWTVGHPLVGPLSAYVETFGLYSSEVGSEYALSLDGGLTFAVTEFVQLDAGVVGGLTEAADDLSVFSGLSFKL
jgi:hypothetical protein